MNIVHISTSDIDGGSARSAYRIHSSLRDAGHVSRMLVGRKSSNDIDVSLVASRLRWKYLDKVARATSDLLSLQYAYLPSSGQLPKNPWIRQADIVQLYNTHGGYFSHRVIPALAKRCPIVWRLSDMWALTGHCSYFGSCDRWKNGCGKCPDLNLYPAIAHDTTARLWAWKREWFSRAEITVVAPSVWALKCAQESPIFADSTILRIPNGIDVDVFKPRDQRIARDLIGIDASCKVVLFVAHGLDMNDRKGVEFISRIIAEIHGGQDIYLVVVGDGEAVWLKDVPCKVKRLGRIEDTRILAMAYASADVVMIPSRVDNLPNVALEALACGIPVAAFDVGGMGDLVRDGATGKLVSYGDVTGLANGISDLLANPERSKALSKAGRELICSEFTNIHERQSFENLYSNLLEQRKNNS